MGKEKKEHNKESETMQNKTNRTRKYIEEYIHICQQEEWQKEQQKNQIVEKQTQVIQEKQPPEPIQAPHVTPPKKKRKNKLNNKNHKEKEQNSKNPKPRNLQQKQKQQTRSHITRAQCNKQRQQQKPQEKQNKKHKQAKIPKQE